VGTDRGDVQILVDVTPRVEVLSPPPGILWPHLIAGHRALAIEPDLIDPESQTVGWTSAVWVREWAGTPLSTYLDCGRSGSGGAVANDARVMADLRTSLIALPDGGTEVRTWLQAVAQPLDGTSRGAVRCSSTRVLERQLAIELRRAYQLALDGEALAGGQAAAPPSVVPQPPATAVRSDRVFDAVQDSGIQPVDQARIIDRYGQRITGTLGALTPGEFSMRIVGRTSTMPWSDLQGFERRVDRRSRGVEGGILGALIGALVGSATDIGISGRYAESQGRVLNPGLGAVAGGLLGAWLGSRIGGGYWVTVPLPGDFSP